MTGSMLPTPIPCSMVDSTTRHPDIRQRLGIAVLRLDEIHDRVRQRTIIANTAGEHVRDTVLDALVHHAGGQQPRRHRLRECRRRVESR